MGTEKMSMNYDASDFLTSGIEAWESGPEIPAVWIELKRLAHGADHAGWYCVPPQIEDLPESLSISVCYRCGRRIFLPSALAGSDEEFCEPCFQKMYSNATLRGMRAQLIALGCEESLIDEMWKLKNK